LRDNRLVDDVMVLAACGESVSMATLLSEAVGESVVCLLIISCFLKTLPWWRKAKCRCILCLKKMIARLEKNVKFKIQVLMSLDEHSGQENVPYNLKQIGPKMQTFES